MSSARLCQAALRHVEAVGLRLPRRPALLARVSRSFFRPLPRRRSRLSGRDLHRGAGREHVPAGPVASGTLPATQSSSPTGACAGRAHPRGASSGRADGLQGRAWPVDDAPWLGEPSQTTICPDPCREAARRGIRWPADHDQNGPPGAPEEGPVGATCGGPEAREGSRGASPGVGPPLRPSRVGEAHGDESSR